MSSRKTHRQCRKLRSSRPRLLLNQTFPKEIRNELRICCALRGVSTMRQGPGLTSLNQQKYLNNFFHGESNKSSSQIRMLAEGISPYDDLYSSRSVSIITSKDRGKKDGKKKKLFLKEELSRQSNRLFFVGDQITKFGLEKIDQDLLLLLDVYYLKR